MMNEEHSTSPRGPPNPTKCGEVDEAELKVGVVGGGPRLCGGKYFDERIVSG